MIVRATAVCVKDDSLLLIKQTFPDMGTFWSLPGGKVEEGESISDALVREVQEEAGLVVRPQRLLYVTQRFVGEKHIVQILMQVTYVSGTEGVDTAPTASEKIEQIAFIPFADLKAHGLSEQFVERVTAGFPDAGTYFESIESIGL